MIVFCSNQSYHWVRSRIKALIHLRIKFEIIVAVLNDLCHALCSLIKHPSFISFFGIFDISSEYKYFMLIPSTKNSIVSWSERFNRFDQLPLVRSAWWYFIDIGKFFYRENYLTIIPHSSKDIKWLSKWAAWVPASCLIHFR